MKLPCKSLNFKVINLKKLKENQVTFQFMLVEILVNLTENDISIDEIKQAQSAVKQNIERH